MIILDETKLRNGTLAMIGEDYGMEIDSYSVSEEEYDKYITSIVERFEFDLDEFKEKLIKAIKDGIKIELKVK